MENERIDVPDIMRHLDFTIRNLAKSILHLDPFAVQCNVENASNITLSELSADIRERKAELLNELLSRALSQNPELAIELASLDVQAKNVRSQQNQRLLETFEALQDKEKAEHRANRKIRYDDSRNINALTGLRRSCRYKCATRIEQIKMEISEYYETFNLKVPFKLKHELGRLERMRKKYYERKCAKTIRAVEPMAVEPMIEPMAS